MKVVAEQPEEAFTVVEFDAEAFGLLAGGRGEARGGDDDPLGEFALGDGADDLPDGGDVDLVVRPTARAWPPATWPDWPRL